MHLWLISQSINKGYDTYDSAVVVADTEDAARLTHPSSDGGDMDYTWGRWTEDGEVHEAWGRVLPYNQSHQIEWGYGTWASPDQVSVSRLGTADDPTPRVICASFKAG